MYKPLVSVSGVRGIVSQSFTEQLVRDWVYAFAQHCRRSASTAAVVLGQDTRPSGEWALHTATDILKRQQVQPIFVGIAPTPTIQLAVPYHQAAGGLIITGSHNPAEWNGLKFLGSDGVFLSAEEMKQLESLAQSQEIQATGGAPLRIREANPKGTSGSRQQAPTHAGQGPAWGPGAVGTVDDQEAIKRHIENVLALPIDLEKIRARKLRVVIDPVNGAGTLALPALLQKLGCSVTVIHGEPNGEFAHPPEPTPANLSDLGAQVKAQKAGLGFAVDPDADRLVLVDEMGTVISEEYTVTLAIMSVLGSRQQAVGSRDATVVVNLSTTRMVDDVAKRFGAQVIRTAVGERHVVEGMREHAALIGGEGNGGVIFPASHEGRDSLVGMALILDFLARQKTTLRDAVDALPRYVMTKEKLPRNTTFHPDTFASNLAKTLNTINVSTLDGVRVDTADGWVHLRPSNTEPIVRLIAEATSERVLQALKRAARSALAHSA